MTQPGSVNNLNTAIGYPLKQAHSSLRAAMDEALRPLGLTVAQYACLELLGRNPGLSNAALARGAFVSRQSMNLVLRNLQDRALVERPSTAELGRVLPTSLTAEGSEVLHRASREIAKIEEAMTQGMSAQQRDQLSTALAQCVANLASLADRGDEGTQ